MYFFWYSKIIYLHQDLFIFNRRDILEREYHKLSNYVKKKSMISPKFMKVLVFRRDLVLSVFATQKQINISKTPGYVSHPPHFRFSRHYQTPGGFICSSSCSKLVSRVFLVMPEYDLLSRYAFSQSSWLHLT